MSDERKNKAIVDIYGQQFSVVGPESISHMRSVASIVDEKMREISDKNPSLDLNKLAVLTAINVVHDYLKLKEDYEALESLLEEKD
ncbi:cell division protein ZapA [Bacillus carboniphilus]|uniref:Cell division protein ZapA n=1 Tax=Bacillus carboniphilus TaxID=86663 RepID=A0ABY9K0S7_9BACI|nr:cell division protein ZapA [Bacillus carboniphilus]WLR44295.1 cell division protein ZapA [Bacillus carboniphilus]